MADFHRPAQLAAQEATGLGQGSQRGLRIIIRVQQAEIDLGDAQVAGQLDIRQGNEREPRILDLCPQQLAQGPQYKCAHPLIS